MRQISHAILLVIMIAGNWGLHAQNFTFVPQPFSEITYSENISAINNFSLPVTQHDKWAFMTANPAGWDTLYLFKAVHNIIKVGVNHSNLHILDNYRYRIFFEVKGKSDPTGGFVTKTFHIDLEYDKDSLQMHNDAVAYKLDAGFHMYETKILDIKDLNTTPPTYTSVNIVNLASNFYIETQVNVQRYDIAAFKLFINSEPSLSTNTLNVAWVHDKNSHSCATLPAVSTYSPVKYELEWTFLDNYTIENYQSGALDDPKYISSGFNIPYSFRNNATRIQTYDNQYKIPLIYEQGVLIFRLRTIRPSTTNYTNLVYSSWSLPDVGTLQNASFNSGNDAPYKCISNCLYFITSAHHNDSLNWQYSISFAEEGKYKHVINYFDGSGLNRQSQTKINTDEDYIVASDKIYDYEGRPAIQTLPIPVMVNHLNYKPDLSLHATSGTPYKASNFDFGCLSDSIAPFHASSLGRLYYSSSNPDKSGMQKFVPDAEGYPFVETIYSSDNTNKVLWQGGAGRAFQRWRGNGTSFSYVHANQYELTRLLGTEGGYAQFYPKQYTRDPNGQTSMTIADPRGKVVATALAGSSPNNGNYPISQLSTLPSVKTITFNILEGLLQQTNNGMRRAEYSFMPEGGGENKFRYSGVIPPYNPECGDEYINIKGYSLVKVTDDCGNIKASRHDTVGATEITTSSVSLHFPGSDTIFSLPPEKHIINKNLTFPDTAIRRMASEFTESHIGFEECYNNEDYFVRKSVEAKEFPCDEDKLQNSSNCDMLKKKMMKELYPGAKYGQYIKNAEGGFKKGINNSIFAYLDDEGKLPSDYVEVNIPQKDTITICKYKITCYSYHGYTFPPEYGYNIDTNNTVTVPQPIGNCDNKYPKEPPIPNRSITILSVHEPFDPCTVADGCWHEGPFDCRDSIFDVNNVEPPVVRTYQYRYQAACLSNMPTVNFVDTNEYGNPVGMQVSASNMTPQQLIRFFNDEIAEALLPLHPEYCKLLICDDGEFEKQLNGIGSYTAAQVLGLNTLSGIRSADPLNGDVHTNAPFTSQLLSNLQIPGSGITKQIDTLALTLAYCGGTSAEAYTYCKNSLFADQISNLTLTGDHLNDIYFGKLRNFYLGNRNLLIQKTRDSAGTCGPCQKFRMTLIPEPVFTQIFTPTGIDIGDEFPDWMNEVYEDGLAGTLTTVPQELLDSLALFKEDRCELQVEHIMEQLVNCPAVNLVTLKSALMDAACISSSGVSVTPTMVMNALSSQSVALSDLCNPFLAKYKIFENGTSSQDNFFVAKGKKFYEGLEDFLNKTEVKTSIANGSSYGSVTIDPVNNAFEEELADLLNITTASVAVATYTKSLSEHGSSFNYKCLVLSNGSLRDTIFLSARNIDNALKGTCTGSSSIPANPATFSFGNVRSAFADKHIPASGGSYIIQNIAYLTLDLSGSCTQYSLWSSSMPLLKLKEADGLDNCISCVALKDAVEDYMSDTATYKLPRYANHPYFESALANYLNFKLDKKHTSDDYQRLMSGCAISDHIGILSAAGFYRLTFSGGSHSTNADNFVSALFTQFDNEVNFDLFRYRNTTAGESVVEVGTGAIPTQILLQVKNYINGYTAGTPVKVYMPEDNHIARVFIKAGGSCTPGFSIANTNVASDDVEVKMMNSYYPYKLFEITYTGTASAKNHSDAIQAVLDNIAGSIENGCAVADFSFNRHLYRSKDYADTDKQEYLEYVYGLPALGYDHEGILAEITPTRLFANNVVSGDFGSYTSPWEYGVKEHLYFSDEATGHSGYSRMSLILDQVKAGLGLSGRLFPVNDVTTVSPGALGGGSTSLKVYKNADGIAWYRLFINDNSMYNVYLLPSDKLADDPSSYTYKANSLVMLPNADSSYNFKLQVQKTISGNPHVVDCYGYTDFPIGSGKMLESVVLYDNEGNWQEMDTSNCERSDLKFAIEQGKAVFARYVDSVKNSHFLAMRIHFPENTVDTLKLTTTEQQYHYTLYYYDLAGNLIRTVPPAGAATISDGQIANANTARNNGDATATYKPAHSKESRYRFNTLGQPFWQETPDAGVTTFYYDSRGRLAFSQNAKQKPERQFSYTVYDDMSRISETGVITFTVAEQPNTNVVPNLVMYSGTSSASGNLKTAINGRVREDVTTTVYDFALLALDQNEGLNAQENLRSRISSVLFSSYLAANNTAFSYFSYGTHFSYDALGNVSTLVQDNPYMDYMGQRFKRIDYDYDLLSGKVNMLSYNRGFVDQIFHRYRYDADNRITEALSSNDGLIWDRDAAYTYYKHGPLAQVEIGDLKVQSMQYAYTIQGWLKAINGDVLDSLADMGQDGMLDMLYPKDVIAHALDYHEGDYKPIGTTPVMHSTPNSPLTKSLYNGNIARQTTALHGMDNLQRNYTYDQLNRLVRTDYQLVDNLTHLVTAMANNAFVNNYSYDADGNMQTLKRYDSSGTIIDSFVYAYQSAANNRLHKVTDLAGATAGNDLQPGQTNNNYKYDAIGNLIADVQGEIDTIKWNAYGKVSYIIDLANDKTIAFYYDGMGNRIRKDVVHEDGTDYTMTSDIYVRDAQGNILAVYNSKSAITDDNFISWVNQTIVNQHPTWTVSSNNGLPNFLTEDVFDANANATIALVDGAIDNHYTWATDHVGNYPIAFYLNNSSAIYNMVAAIPISNYLGEVHAAAGSPGQQFLNMESANAASLMLPLLDVSGPDATRAIATLNLIQQETPDLALGILQALAVDIEDPDNYDFGDVAFNSALSAYGADHFFYNGFMPALESVDPYPFYDALLQDNSILSATWLDNNETTTLADFKDLFLNYTATKAQVIDFFDNWITTNDPTWLNGNVTLDLQLTTAYQGDPLNYVGHLLNDGGINVLNNAVKAKYASEGGFMYALDYLRRVRRAILVTGNLSTTYVPPTVNNPTPGNLQADTLTLGEHHLYGSSRLGIKTYDENFAFRVYYDETNDITDSSLSTKVAWYNHGFADWIQAKKTSIYTSSTLNVHTDTLRQTRRLGSKFYELSDHLGNVLSTVVDRKSGYGNNSGSYVGYWANIVSLNDYYPFGMIMPNRSIEERRIRMGYNGKENDDDIYGKGNLQNYGMRMYRPDIVKFISVDPLAREYPWYSTYHFAGNNPIRYIDLDGGEPKDYLPQTYYLDRSLIKMADDQITYYNALLPNIAYRDPVTFNSFQIRNTVRYINFNSKKRTANLGASQVYYNASPLGPHDCITSLNNAINILLDLPFENKWLNESRIDLSMKKLGMLGYAQEMGEVYFYNTSNISTGNKNASQLIRASDAMIGNVSDIIESSIEGSPGHHVFALSMLDGYHSMLLFVNNTDPAKVKYTIADQVIGANHGYYSGREAKNLGIDGYLEDFSRKNMNNLIEQGGGTTNKAQAKISIYRINRKKSDDK